MTGFTVDAGTGTVHMKPGVGSAGLAAAGTESFKTATVRKHNTN